MSKEKNPQKGLGRGLSALMSDIQLSDVQTEPVNAGSGFLTLGVAQISPNPEQPRQIFDRQQLAELADSIARQGVLQPILVRPLDTVAGQYQIIAGERRWQAAMQAGLDMLPVLVRDLSDQEALEVGIIENIQRTDLNPIEEAFAYQTLIRQFGHKQDEVAQAVGKSRAYVANLLRLLKLPESVRDLIQAGKISAGHGRAVLMAPDPLHLAHMIMDKGLSVREAEQWVRRLRAGIKGGGTGGFPKPADIRQIEQGLIEVLGLEVDLRHKDPGGELRIRYNDGTQLESLLGRLGGLDS